MAARHLPYLDGWRGLAIVALLVGHFFPVPGINLGAVGVNLFFVLSGYLMGGLLFVKRTPLPVFYRRRIARIVPAHVVFIGCMVAAYALLDLPVAWDEALAALLFFNNYYSNNAMPLGHIWSLSVEEHSYILLSIVALLSRRLEADPKWPIAGMVALFVGAGVWYWSQYSGDTLEFGLWIRTEVAAFGIFASCALLLFLGGRRIAGVPGWICPLLVAAGLALHWWSMPLPIRTALGVGAFALAINLLPAAPAAVRRLLEFRWLTLMGTWSFSIYLWQQPFYVLSGKYEWMPAYVAAPLAIGFGIASFYLVENPMRTYLNRVWGRSDVKEAKLVAP